MKFSLRILFLACMVVAIVTVLAMRRIEWPVIASAGLGVLLLWARFDDIARTRAQAKLHGDQAESGNQATNHSSGSNCLQAPFMDWILLAGIAACLAYAVFSMMTKVVPQNTEYKAFYFRSIPASSIVILTTVVLASGLVPTQPQRSTHLSLAGLTVLLRSIAFILYCFSLDIAIWLVYLACKGIEQGMVDPGRVLGKPEVLSFGSAFVKAWIGMLGIILWVLAARTVVQRVQQNEKGWFFKAWLIGGVSCLATFVLWYVLLEDFPQMWAALSAIQQQPFQFNTFVVGLLFVMAFVQYCITDRTSKRESHTQEDSNAAEYRWRNRLLGLAMIVPGFLFFVLFLLPLRRFKNFDVWTWFYVFIELLSVAPLMLLALLVLGFTFMTNALESPPRRISISSRSLFQVVVMAIVLVICMPIHLPAMLFYLDAILTLPVKW